MKVFIVDDDAIARTALKDALSKQGKLRFEECENGEEAWKRLDEGLAPALCLFDIRMPGLDGIELLGRLRRDPRFLGIPVIIVTSSVDKNLVIRAGATGLDGIVVKPVESRQIAIRVFPLLTQFIESLLASPGKIRQKLNIDHQHYMQTLESLLRKGQASAAALRAASDGDGDKLIRSNIAAMENKAGSLGAMHLEASLKRISGLLETQSGQAHRGQSAGMLEISLSLFRDGLDWHGIAVSP